MKTKTASLLLGIIFLAAGLLGFVPNPIIGMHDAIFHADTVHSIVHIVSGLFFLFFALAMPEKAHVFMMAFGAIYFLIGVLGMINIGSEGTTQLLGFLHVNGADNYFHMGMGAISFLAGFLRPKSRVVA